MIRTHSNVMCNVITIQAVYRSIFKVILTNDSQL